jgi:hypothetical protein
MYSAYQSGQFGSAFPVRASCLPVRHRRGNHRLGEVAHRRIGRRSLHYAALRSDDNSVAQRELSREIVDLKQNCHPDRSAA